ncbi:hypothetical protein [Streptomyces acidiscabies]|uniref:hypothetical protein n=1 Tax=Streptomyces acidiscabies TaxID=42234 RepID=UPI0038F6A33A
MSITGWRAHFTRRDLAWPRERTPFLREFSSLFADLGEGLDDLGAPERWRRRDERGPRPEDAASVWSPWRDGAGGTMVRQVPAETSHMGPRREVKGLPPKPYRLWRNAEAEAEEAFARGQFLAEPAADDRPSLTGPAGEEAEARLRRILAHHDTYLCPGTFITCVYTPDRALCRASGTTPT